MARTAPVSQRAVTEVPQVRAARSTTSQPMSGSASQICTVKVRTKAASVGTWRQAASAARSSPVS